MGVQVNVGAAYAASGRSLFVNRVVEDFAARSRIAVSGEVRSFILSEVLVADDVWTKGLSALNASVPIDPDRSRQILDRTGLILTEALVEAAAKQFGGSVPGGAELGISSVGTRFHGPFYEVIDLRWKCPFPFYFC